MSEQTRPTVSVRERAEEIVADTIQAAQRCYSSLAEYERHARKVVAALDREGLLRGEEDSRA